jgi:hypothetical protein
MDGALLDGAAQRAGDLFGHIEMADEALGDA